MTMLPANSLLSPLSEEFLEKVSGGWPIDWAPVKSPTNTTTVHVEPYLNLELTNTLISS